MHRRHGNPPSCRPRRASMYAVAQDIWDAHRLSSNYANMVIIVIREKAAAQIGCMRDRKVFTPV